MSRKLKSTGFGLTQQCPCDLSLNPRHKTPVLCASAIFTLQRWGTSSTTTTRMQLRPLTWQSTSWLHRAYIFREQPKNFKPFTLQQQLNPSPQARSCTCKTAMWTKHKSLYTYRGMFGIRKSRETKPHRKKTLLSINWASQITKMHYWQRAVICFLCPHLNNFCTQSHHTSNFLLRFNVLRY